MAIRFILIIRSSLIQIRGKDKPIFLVQSQFAVEWQERFSPPSAKYEGRGRITFRDATSCVLFDRIAVYAVINEVHSLIEFVYTPPSDLCYFFSSPL